MKKTPVLLFALTLSPGSVQAASFSEADTYRSLAVWHSGEANPYELRLSASPRSSVRTGGRWKPWGTAAP